MRMHSNCYLELVVKELTSTFASETAIYYRPRDEDGGISTIG